MANLLSIRSQELVAEFIKFQNKVYQNKPKLNQNSIFQFTIKLNKKGNWICQCLSEPEEVEIVFCKTATTLLKRLSYLSKNGKLDFAQDTENSNEFHIALQNKTVKKRRISKARQLQFSF
jgi:hypothetical protein